MPLAGCGKSRVIVQILRYSLVCVTRCGGRPMRGWDERSDALFSYVSCEARVPKDHPLRPIRYIVDEALGALSPEFEKLYARFGRPSIPPETASRSAVGGLLLGALGAAVDGAARLQSAVPLVCRAVGGCRGMGRHCVHQKPRAPDRGGYRSEGQR